MLNTLCLLSYLIVAILVKVHWKWSQRITRLLIQCLESTEYMEIRNALILLTKISSVFPVTRKSGINLEKRVYMIVNTGLCL